MIASVIKERRRGRSGGGMGKGNGQEDALVISEMLFMTRLHKEKKQKRITGGGGRGAGGETREVGGGRDWTRSPRPRGVDLDRCDLSAEAQQMRLCVRIRVRGKIFLCTDLCGRSEECVDVCETKRDERE